MAKKILVTGSTGFIGRRLVDKLLTIGHEVVAISRKYGDIADEAVWHKLPVAEVVIHLAGKTFVPDSWKKPLNFIKTNFHGTVCALNYCKTNNAKIIFLSSYLYGQPEKLPISEIAPLKANNPYALSKKLSEEACHFYADFYSINTIILRPFNVYGPGQGEQFLIPSIIKKISVGEKITVKDLEPKRDYVYIDDLIDAIIKSLSIDSFDNLNIFNVGTGVSHSVGDVINLIQKLKGTNLCILSANERRLEEIMDTQADITRAIKILKWSPTWTLEQGISEMLNISNHK